MVLVPVICDFKGFVKYNFVVMYYRELFLAN